MVYTLICNRLNYFSLVGFHPRQNTLDRLTIHLPHSASEVDHRYGVVSILRHLAFLIASVVDRLATSGTRFKKRFDDKNDAKKKSEGERKDVDVIKKEKRWRDARLRREKNESKFPGSFLIFVDLSKVNIV